MSQKVKAPNCGEEPGSWRSGGWRAGLPKWWPLSPIVFIAEQKVDWNYALPMMAAAILGGYLGARLVLVVQPRHTKLLIRDRPWTRCLFLPAAMTGMGSRWRAWNRKV